MIKSSIRHRLTILLLSMGIIGLVLFMGFALKVTEGFIHDVQEREMRLAAQAIGPVLGVAVEMDLEANIDEDLKILTDYETHIAGIEIITKSKKMVRGFIPHDSRYRQFAFPLKGSLGDNIGTIVLYVSDEAYKDVKFKYFIFSIIFLLFLIAMGFFVQYIIRRTLSPLEALAERIKAYTPGTPWRVDPFDSVETEVSLISNALSETTTLVTRYYESLQQSHQMLELKVRERTSQLVTLNEELVTVARREQQLRMNNEAFNNQIFDAMAFPLSIRDENFDILRANKAYLSLFNITFHDLQGLKGLYPGDELTQEMITKDDGEGGWELVFTTSEGEQKTLYVMTNELKVEDQRGYIVALADVTQLKKVEHEKNIQQQMLMQQAKLASMGEMIGNIAHQWRQPLAQMSSLLIHLEGAHEFGVLDDTLLKSQIRHGEKLISFMSQTIEDFRHFFLPNKHKTIFSVTKAIHEALDIMSASLSFYHIHIDFEGDDCQIQGYETEFSQVILNLLSNAKDVLIDRSVHGPIIFMRMGCTKEGCWVTIEDNAGGIDEEVLPQIFEPYFTTKHKSQGTGIGLYMAKMIIENNMGGHITITNGDYGAQAKIVI